MKKCTFGLGACTMSWLICGVSYVWADNGAAPRRLMAPTSSTLPSDMGPSGSALNRGVKHLFPQAVPKGEDDVKTSVPTRLADFSKRGG